MKAGEGEPPVRSAPPADDPAAGPGSGRQLSLEALWDEGDHPPWQPAAPAHPRQDAPAPGLARVYALAGRRGGQPPGSGSGRARGLGDSVSGDGRSTEGQGRWADAARRNHLERSTELLALPAYHFWDLPAGQDGLMLALQRARRCFAGAGAAAEEDDVDGRAEAREHCLDPVIDALLRQAEDTSLPDLLATELEHQAGRHRQAGERDSAELADAAAAALRSGLMLADHPLVRGLARRSLLRRLGRDGQALLIREVHARLRALLPLRRKASPGPAGRAGRKVMLLAVVLRSHPEFGSSRAAPATAAGLDRLALELARGRVVREQQGGGAAARQTERRGLWLAACNELVAGLEEGACSCTT